MACFIVPAAEAVVVGVVKKVAEKKEAESTVAGSTDNTTGHEGITFATKLGWLFKMLIGGAVLLLFEHVWHGEIVPYPPFITAMYSAGDTAEMLHEMSTVGVSMAVLITFVWVGMVVISGIMERRAETKAGEER